MSSTEMLDQLLKRLSTALPPEEVEKLRSQALTEMAVLRWIPNPGAQSAARDSLADQLLFGGKAGGGKSDILIGLATTDHQRSLLLRRINKEVHFLVDRTEEILGHSKGYNGQHNRWYLPDNRLIMYGGCQHSGDEKGYKGEPKDLIGIDEASEFLESQVDFLSEGAEIGRTHVVVLSSPCGSTARILSLYLEPGERLTLADVRTMIGRFLEVFPDVEEFIANRWRGWGRPTKPVWISTKPAWIRARARRSLDPDAARRSIGANGGPPLEVELAS
jgi:hypothetical protein